MTFLLAFLLIVSVTFGGNPKKAEDRDVKEQAVVMGAMAPSSAWLPISTAGTFRGIAFAFDGSVWVSGYSGTNTVGLVSNVARDSWKQFTIVNPDPGITRFAPKNKDTACVGTFTGQILRTTNGGAKWDTVFSFGDGTLYINDIMYVDASTMVASGDADGNGLLVVRSTNDGATWTRITNLPAEDLTADKYAHYATYRSPIDVVGGLIFMTTFSGSTVQPRILRSDDKGLSWISWAVTLPGTLSNNYYFRSISFKDTSIGCAVGRRAYGTTTDFDNPLIKTTDGGKTWSDTLTFNNKIPHKDQKPVYISILR